MSPELQAAFGREGALEMRRTDQIERYYRALSDAQTLRARRKLTAAIQEKIKRLGFRYFTYWRLRPASGPRIPLFANTYPKSFIERHLKFGYDTDDPMAIRAARSREPFCWDELRRIPHLTRRQRSVLDEGQRYGLRSGGTIPKHGPGAAKALFAVATSKGDEEFRVLFESCLDALDQIATFAHAEFAKISLPLQLDPRLKLSAREGQALTYTALGRSTKQIAREMQRSPETVKDYLDNARKKLGARNKGHAVAIAMWHNLILPTLTLQTKPLTWHGNQALALTARGYSTSKIASEMQISRATVKRHLRTCRRRLGANGTANAIALALWNAEINP